MALFSRRDIQAAIDYVGDSISALQWKCIIGNLNGHSPVQCIAAEWEAVLLAAFRRQGRVEYERDFGGDCKPDLFFQMGDSGTLEFAADITTVSDADAHTRNPFEEFSSAIWRSLHRLGCPPAGLYLDVKHEEIGKYGDQKIRLCLPEKGEIDAFVKSEVKPFLTNIAKEPHKAALHTYNKNGIRFDIRYDPADKRFSGGGHLAYTVPYSLRRNPLYHALKDKSAQLSKSTYSGPRGIIVCDGDSDSLKEQNSGSGACGRGRIIQPFLRSHTSVFFVLVLRIEEVHRVLQFGEKVQIAPKVYWNACPRTFVEQMTEILRRAVRGLPSPESSPGNALRWLRSPKGSTGRLLGSTSMQGNTIKISARSLTELLAGKVEVQDFLQNHGLKPIDPGDHAFPFFENQIQRGNTLKNAFVEREENKDDDWLVLEYDGPDAANSRYRLPK